MGQPLYDVIWLLFKIGSKVFYASFDIRNVENIPKDEPTILTFNHGNSLGDAIVLISATPRTIRFCAKNTLWDIPIISHMIRMSGAVQVFRRREHGDKAAEFNVETFRAVYKALEEGDCVGFSPEGVSSFRSYATKFKSGVAHIALEAVSRAVERGDDKFKVNIVPSVMAFTHREKFRSDVLVRYRPPIVVDKSWLTKYDTRKEAANTLIKMVEDEYHENMITAPDWKKIKYAITATRIHRPFGTYLSLSEYFYLLKGWLEVMKLDPETKAPDGGRITVAKLFESLESYQNLLDVVKVKDERIRRIEKSGKRPSSALCIRIILYRVLICSILFLVAMPGLIGWSPVWYLIKRKERELLGKGIGWVDSIAENKMMVGFFSVVLLILVTNIYAPLILAYLWLTMRLYEEAVASARSIFGIYRLMMLSDEKIEVLLAARKQAKEDIAAGVSLFSKETAERYKLESNGDDVFEDKMNDESVESHRWWTNFNPVRRRKKDWNELLRLSDFCTMDYVE